MMRSITTYLAPACARLMSTRPPTAVQITKTTSPKIKLPKEQLVFGKTFTDHLLTMDWSKPAGWTAPQITAYAPFCLDPAATVFHYALACFEGMKAYVDDDNQIRLFRPDMNMKRLLNSADRLVMPCPDEHIMLDGIKELVKLDKDWIPKGLGYSLYIRPTLISTYPFLGVAPSEAVRFYTIMSPVGPYYASGFKAVSLYADHEHVRAWPGGAGGSKIGANYAPAIKAQRLAMSRGFAQVLWLFGPDLQITEVGTMNQFFFFKNRDGEPELVTAPLTDGTILPGITRDSILTLCREWGEFKVSERKITLHEVMEAVEEDRMIEAFGSGTAAIVSPVKSVHFQGKDYPIPLDPKDPNGQAGALTQRISRTIMDIQVGRVLRVHTAFDTEPCTSQYGKVDHPWSVIVK
ncbi:Branched-chain-amino-acid transaminase [Plasmodiophora brassicae]